MFAVEGRGVDAAHARGGEEEEEEEEVPEGAVGAGVWAVPLAGRGFELNAWSWRVNSLHMGQGAAKFKGQGVFNHLVFPGSFLQKFFARAFQSPSPSCLLTPSGLQAGVPPLHITPCDSLTGPASMLPVLLLLCILVDGSIVFDSSAFPPFTGPALDPWNPPPPGSTFPIGYFQKQGSTDPACTKAMTRFQTLPTWAGFETDTTVTSINLTLSGPSTTPSAYSCGATLTLSLWPDILSGPTTQVGDVVPWLMNVSVGASVNITVPISNNWVLATSQFYALSVAVTDSCGGASTPHALLALVSGDSSNTLWPSQGSPTSQCPSGSFVADATLPGATFRMTLATSSSSSSTLSTPTPSPTPTPSATESPTLTPSVTPSTGVPALNTTSPTTSPTATPTISPSSSSSILVTTPSTSPTGTPSSTSSSTNSSSSGGGGGSGSGTLPSSTTTHTHAPAAKPAASSSSEGNAAGSAIGAIVGVLLFAFVFALCISPSFLGKTASCILTCRRSPQIAREKWETVTQKGLGGDGVGVSPKMVMSRSNPLRESGAVVEGAETEGEEGGVRVPRMAPIFDAPYTPSPSRGSSKKDMFAAV